jgi:caffeoyl-CoA O-methyltransferase
MVIVEKSIENYAFDHTASEPELLLELQKETYETMEWPNMITGRMEGRFLKMLVQITNAKNILEIGTFTGYSALCMAEGLPADGKIITCDINENSRDFAQKYFDRSEYGHKIELKFGPALDTIKTLKGPFDLVFIDADKSNYPNYYELCLPLVRSGGLIVIDNTLWSGLVLKPENNATKAIDAINKTVVKDSRVENVLLTVRDGIQLIRKK